MVTVYLNATREECKILRSCPNWLAIITSGECTRYVCLLGRNKYERMIRNYCNEGTTVVLNVKLRCRNAEEAQARASALRMYRHRLSILAVLSVAADVRGTVQC